MFKKINGARVILLISLMGAALFGYLPSISQAQYSNYPSNNYFPNNTQLYVTTDGTTFVTGNSATLNGGVGGNTSNLTTWFEYGTTSSLGMSTARNNYNYANINFSATIGSLSSGTIYYFRAVAQNTWGVVYGNINSFRTNFGNYPETVSNYNPAPTSLTAYTRPTTSVGTRTVSLNSLIINTPANPTSTWFEWGTDYSLSNQTPVVSVGTFAEVRHISTITKLAPSTTYYFRAVVVNASTRSNGAILSFTTRSAATPSTLEPVAPKDTIEETKIKLEDLSAKAMGAGDFLPDSLFGWVILAILVAILIILARNLYVKK